MSEIGAGYYRGQDSHISVGDIVAIVISITFGLPIVVCLVYLLYVWARACYHRDEMRRDGTMGDGFFWCWKTSSQVQLSVDELVAAVPAVLPRGKETDSGSNGASQSSQGKAEGRAKRADRSGSSTPTESDAGVELTTKHSTFSEVSGGGGGVQQTQRQLEQLPQGHILIEVS